MSSRSFSFVHVADLHLDSPLKGITAKNPAIADPLRSATFRAFDALIDLCIEREVQFLWWPATYMIEKNEAFAPSSGFTTGWSGSRKKTLRPMWSTATTTLTTAGLPHSRIRPRSTYSATGRRIDTFSRGKGRL